MTPSQRYPKPRAERKYRAIHEILSGPNLGPPPPINIPRVDDDDDINAGQSYEGQNELSAAQREVVVELVAAERDEDGNGDVSNRQSNSGPVVAELGQTSGTRETPQRAKNLSEAEETTLLALQHVAQIPKHRTCGRKSRSIDELLSAPDFPMPPPVPRRPECNAEALTIVAVPFPPPVPQGTESSELAVGERAESDENILHFGIIMKHDEEVLALEAEVDAVDIEDVEIFCSQCGSGEREEDLLLCEKCNRGFHTACARPIIPKVPNGAWICSECSRLPQAPSLSEWDITNFLGIQDFGKGNEGRSGASATGKKRKKRGRSFPWRRKSKRQWLPYVPSKDKSKRLEQLGSLAQALISLDLEYTDELLYTPDMAPRSANQTAFDSNEVQVLQKSNEDIWNLCKAMHRRGECPPLKVVYDTDRGYMVIADGPIEDKTFICEYTGFVDYFKKRELDDSNSLIDLLLTDDESKDLVICQDRCGNISHFFSGINNYNAESKKKQNCTFIRCNVDGKCRIFVVTIRRIKAGIPLYIDYNGGGSVNTFPTQNFV